MTDEDYKTVQAMRQYGGAFAYALGNAALHADESNYNRLKAAFPDYWLKYSAVANQLPAAIIEKHPMAEYQKDE